jgi:REP-associated tyrosine transposase
MPNQVMAQRAFEFRTWGGKRIGAGRKPIGAKARLRHDKRPVLKKRFPVHVTWRMRSDVSWLRKPRCFRALARAFWGGSNRFGFRLIHYSVQGNHLHLLVEAADERSLARGMNGLGVRVAKGLNKVLRRHGKVLDERYHGHILRTPTEVRNARAYLTGNAERHFGMKGVDPYTSRKPVRAPETFLMRRHC